MLNPLDRRHVWSVEVYGFIACAQPVRIPLSIEYGSGVTCICSEPSKMFLVQHIDQFVVEFPEAQVEVEKMNLTIGLTHECTA